MKKRVVSLYNDARLNDLMVTPEFKDARQRLFYMLKRITNGEQINGEDQQYIERAEKHIKNIERHWVTGVVNGQPQTYLMITKIEEVE